ncbi:transposase [Thermus scotoductus]|uniref:transposase n=1 Tax=Thermus scotoductus TaxID=37636 RepID=UPI0020A5D48E|nr:transposase [Thermus scotoductus]
MTRYDPQRHHRRSIRLKEYDYTQPGAYFITICTHGRAPLFGDVVDGEMRLNEMGEIVRVEWFKTVQLRPYVVLHEDEFVVMPNHIHGIIWIVDDVGATHHTPHHLYNSPKPDGGEP